MKKNKIAKCVTASVSVVLAAAIGVGAWYMLAGKRSPVAVYQFGDVGMTEYFGYATECDGTLLPGRVQTVYASDTLTVKEILVNEGDTVKSGDVLMRYDTTLTEISIERKRLEIEKLKLRQNSLNADLEAINKLEPYVPIPSPEPTPDPEPEPDRGEPIEEPYTIIADGEHDGLSELSPIICLLRSDTLLDRTLYETLLSNADDSDTVYVVMKIASDDMTLGESVMWQGLVICDNDGDYSVGFFDASWVEDPTVPAADPVPDDDTADDTDNSDDLPEHRYTAAEIAEMRADKEKEIRENSVSIRIAESEYKIMQSEGSGSEVRAKLDGIVTSVTALDEAGTSKPIIKISGGTGYSISGNIDEFSRESISVGDTVTVTDWMNGMTVDGTIESISDSPSSDNSYYGMVENPNVTYYPFTVQIGDDADLTEDGYFTIELDGAEQNSGIYLMTPFVRTEGGESYVLVSGDDGRLVRRSVTTGKLVWEYVEILSGVSETDEIAFPYGKNAAEGAPTEPGDPSDLYDDASY